MLDNNSCPACRSGIMEPSAFITFEGGYLRYEYVRNFFPNKKGVAVHVCSKCQYTKMKATHQLKDDMKQYSNLQRSCNYV